MKDGYKTGGGDGEKARRKEKARGRERKRGCVRTEYVILAYVHACVHACMLAWCMSE